MGYKQVVIFFFFFIVIIITIIIIIIIIIIHYISSFAWKYTFLFYIDSFKVKCWKGITTINVIVFIFKYILIWFDVFIIFEH